MSRRNKEKSLAKIILIYYKMIFNYKYVFKGWKQRSRKWCSDQESYKVSSMKPKWKVKIWCGVWLNGKISLIFFNKNMTNELYLKILNEKSNQLRKKIY